MKKEIKNILEKIENMLENSSLSGLEKMEIVEQLDEINELL
jgi:uncharacterized coiled-coil DUF342 family protein